MSVETDGPNGRGRRILVVANETMLGDVLHDAVRRRRDRVDRRPIRHVVVNLESGREYLAEQMM